MGLSKKITIILCSVGGVVVLAGALIGGAAIGKKLYGCKTLGPVTPTKPSVTKPIGKPDITLSEKESWKACGDEIELKVTSKSDKLTVKAKDKCKKTTREFKVSKAYKKNSISINPSFEIAWNEKTKTVYPMVGGELGYTRWVAENIGIGVVLGYHQSISGELVRSINGGVKFDFRF